MGAPTITNPGPGTGQSGTSGAAAAITPNDSTDITPPPRALYVGVTGNVSVLMQDGDVIVFQGAQAGSVLPVRPQRVRATGTTATGIVALY